MNKNTPMTPAAASRIQSHADQTETNADFKARAQKAAAATTTAASAHAATSGKDATTTPGKK